MRYMESVTWVSIVEASLDDLRKLEQQLGASSCDQKDGKVFYTKILLAYFRNNSADISFLIEAHNKFLVDRPTLKILSLMRFHLRAADFTLSDLFRLHDQVRNIESGRGLFFAEACFIAGTACLQKSEYRQAEEFYLQAATHYEFAGSFKKSIRAQLSSLAAYTCVFPESRLFHEYSVIHEKAMAVGERLSAGTALINISRELQRIKALPHALTTIDKALDILKEDHRSSREFSLAMAQRADLYFQLDKKVEGTNDVIFALCHPHAEVQSACHVLAQKYQLDLLALQSQTILPTWQERKNQNSQSEILTVMESLLLKLLSERPRAKSDLMDALFGEKISTESKNNRFKNLISRVRSKVPGVIVIKDGIFSIQDEFSFEVRFK